MKREIRFLITSACNYHCYFCHFNNLASQGDWNCIEELSIDDYTKLYELFSKVEKANGVTLSGGEPLLYREIAPLCKALSEKGAEITIVTNGFYLMEKKEALQYVKKINVSLHTLDDELYKYTIGRDEKLLPVVIKNLKQIRKLYPNLTIHINITPTLLNFSIDSLKDMIKFAKKINASIKYNELFPSTLSSFVSIETIKPEIEKLGYKPSEKNYRAECYTAQNKPNIYLTQCTCTQAKKNENPMQFCRSTNDVYVNSKGFLSLCRFENKYSINIIEDLKTQNYEMIKIKLKVAMHRIPWYECKQNLSKC